MIVSSLSGIVAEVLVESEVGRDRPGAGADQRVAVRRGLRGQRVPELPPAPGLFSTMIGWPIDFDILLSMMRLTTSLALPPANGMITVIGAGRIALRAAAAPHDHQRDGRAHHEPLGNSFHVVIPSL